MKKVILTILFFSLVSFIHAQKGKDSLPPYLQYKIIPPFKLTLPNDSFFAKKDIPPKTPVIVIYFDPECSHCQLFAKDLVDSNQYINKAFIVMAAYKNMDLISKFKENYKLDSIANIVVGRDSKYVIPGFFKIKIIPFVALYNKKGNLIDVFREGISISKIHDLLDL